MALRSQGPPGLASNRDRRDAPPWRVLPLVVVICAIYRPPSASIRDFNDLLFNNILDKFPNNIRVIITGDFNINLYNPYKTKTISDFISG